MAHVIPGLLARSLYSSRLVRVDEATASLCLTELGTDRRAHALFLFCSAQHFDAHSALDTHPPVMNCLPWPLPTFLAPDGSAVKVMRTILAAYSN